MLIEGRESAHEPETQAHDGVVAHPGRDSGDLLKPLPYMSATNPAVKCVVVPCVDSDDLVLVDRRQRGAGKPVGPAPVPGVGVSLDDVAGFVPRGAGIRSQPNGWAVVGVPANFVTDASEQVVDGVLLGRAAQVRFVPVSFVWDYGDGVQVAVSGAGASWRELGQRDFTATATSHVFGVVGERRVSVTVGYVPSYRFDGGAWQQVVGTVPVTVGPVVVRVMQGSTVLVGGVCGSRNAGPGC